MFNSVLIFMFSVCYNLLLQAEYKPRFVKGEIMSYYLAVDIGATSGRHILSHIENGKIITEEIYRFNTHSAKKNSKWVWECEKLFENIVKGMKECARIGKIPDYVGVDSWGADYVLLDKSGEVLTDAAQYRSEAAMLLASLRSKRIMPTEKYYELTGISKTPVDTIYQLIVLKKKHGDVFKKASRLMMIPSFINYKLTGNICEEYNSSVTTGLVNAKTKSFDKDLIDRLGFPQELFGELHSPGKIVGTLKDEIKKEVGYDCKVALVPSHDTSSAFLASPSDYKDSITISSGTWSIFGIENDAPVTTREALKAGFTNEGTYKTTSRLSKMVVGMFILESLKSEMNNPTYEKMIEMAREAEKIKSVIDLNDLTLTLSSNMSRSIKLRCFMHGQRVPSTDGELLQVFFHSMAVTYAKLLKDLENITGRTYKAIHIVGGGSRNGYINELTRKETGLPVYAGPAEATVAGNLLSQMLTSGEFENMKQAKEACARSFEIKEYN